MSIWLLLAFAISMASTLLLLDAPAVITQAAAIVLIVSLLVFLLGVILRGIRRPVI